LLVKLVRGLVTFGEAAIPHFSSAIVENECPALVQARGDNDRTDIALFDVVTLGLHHALASNRGPINDIAKNSDDGGDRNKQHVDRSNIAVEPVSG